ncbi:hypothetical protein [uncultured Draconibacterium sp.]|uniref:hypothetical protein n=1 Tax=uncultured Draconibacterium sp. TaxID=1573823 RepID=UPI0025DAF247|nr:hypothetical protein [uncultured Draconibacterium sp.]
MVDQEFGNTYPALKNKLKYQNSVFAAFKSANQTLTLEHLKKASEAKTFTDFAEEALSTTNDYNYTHLKAEWNAAKRACRSAKRWAKAVEDSDLFPNIKYLKSTAKNPRDKHKEYYDMVFAMDDPLLDSILPPSDWGCQCGWTTTDEELSVMKGLKPVADPGLDNNPGKDGALIAPSHPHIQKNRKRAEVILRQNICEVYGIEDSEIFEFYHNSKSNGCYFSVEKLAKIEKKANKRIAKIFANRGSMVELHGHDSLDSMVNGRWNEFKTPTKMTFNNFDKELQHANRQFKSRDLTGDVTFELPDKYDAKIIKTAFRQRINRMKDVRIENVHFVTKDKYLGVADINDVLNGDLPI